MAVLLDDDPEVTAYMQVTDLKSTNNVVFVTHYVVIAELINYFPESGEIIEIDKFYSLNGLANSYGVIWRFYNFNV